MRQIIKKFVQFPFYANMLIAFFLLAGGFSLSMMKKSFFPEMTSRMISVSVYYPGASPREMEEGVTSRIEEAVRGLVGIKEITSSSSENSAYVNIETTGDYDIDLTMTEVKNAVDGISSFPSAAERPIVRKTRTVSRVLRLGLTGDVDILTLKGYANQIEEDLLSSGHITQVTITDAPVPEISIEIDEEDMLRYKLTFNDIFNAVRNNNNDISGGQLRSDEEDVLIRLRSRSSDPDKISNIILRANEDGSFLRIRDVAIVKKKYSDDFMGTYLNGKEAVLMRVEKLPEEDMKAISDYTLDYIETFNKEHDDVTLKLVRNRMNMLTKRLDLLLDNGFLGLILVIVSLALFLNFRLSLWVAWGIPSSFLAMFIVAQLWGVTINMISLFGMILVIGILVDDGIVIAENIFTHFEKGKSAKRAAVDGTMEVVPAVMTSVVTTMLAFTPLLFAQGRMEMIFEMAFIVIFALLFSLFEAFFVLPAHVGSKHVLNPKVLKHKDKGFRKYLERFIIYLREELYGPFLEWILRNRYPAMAFATFLVLVTAGLVGGSFIRTTFFPTVDFDDFEVNIAFTPGSGEKQTYEYLQRCEKTIWEVNEELKEKYKDSVDYINTTFLTVGRSFQGQERGAHAGRIIVIPRDLDEMELTGMEISEMVRKKIGKIPEARKFTVAGRSRWGMPVSISIMSKNLDEIELAKQYLIDELHNIPALKDIVDNNAQGKQEIRLRLTKKAYFLGLNENTLVSQVRNGFYGGQIQRIQEGRDELRVWVRFPKEGRKNIGQLENMKIKTAKGEFPLSELADYEVKRGPVSIRRLNGKREARIEADLVDPFASVPEILGQVKTEIIPELKARYPGVYIAFQGQQKASDETMTSIGRSYTVAFLLIVVILMMHFKSMTQALVILLMIPLSILGVLWGHGIHMKPVSLMSLWGIVALSGVVINDAVVFLAKYNSLIAEGNKVRDAIVMAGKARLRAIILTSITTSVGLFPMILEKSPQAQFLIPTAISLAYGVAFGTVFILVFFPVLLHVLNDMKVYMRYLWTGTKPTREEVCMANINKHRESLD